MNARTSNIALIARTRAAQAAAVATPYRQIPPRPSSPRRTTVPRHRPPVGTPMLVANDALLTLTEAADVLRVSVRQVQRLRATGVLPATRIGARAVVRVSDLDAYMAALGAS